MTIIKTYKPLVLILTVLILSAIPGESAICQQESPLLKFRNMTIGMGFNNTGYDITYAETPGYVITDDKSSLLIDIRANFLTLYNLRLSGSFQFWSWTDNSGTRINIPQNGMNDFSFIFDLVKDISISERFGVFGGGGGGMHMIKYWTQFPRFNPFYENFTGAQLNHISVNTTLFSPDILTGIEYKMMEGLYLTFETRYEFTRELKQWKYSFSISLFN
jgi:hypothetical protein